MTNCFRAGPDLVHWDLTALGDDGPYRLSVHHPHGSIVEYFGRVSEALVREGQLEALLIAARTAERYAGNTDMTASILVVTVIEKFFEGGWMTMLITALVIVLCLFIRTHYRETKEKIKRVDEVFSNQPFGSHHDELSPDTEAPTAVFIVGSSRGGGLHALLWVQRMFPGHFKNFMFVNVRTVDAQAYGGEGEVEKIGKEAQTTLNYFVDFCTSHGLASAAYLGFGTDAVSRLTEMCEAISKGYPRAIFFTSKLIFEQENWFTRLLHNQAALAIQRRLHFKGLQMIILPMKI